MRYMRQEHFTHVKQDLTLILGYSNYDLLEILH